MFDPPIVSEDYPLRDDRLPWPVTVLLCAQALAEARSTCQRFQVGCIITDERHGRWFVGFNGNYAGGPNYCDDPTIPGGCQCVHAEDNALARCDSTIPYKIAYVTAAPCKMCAKKLINADVKEVYYSSQYRHTEGVALLDAAGVKVLRVDMGAFDRGETTGLGIQADIRSFPSLAMDVDDMDDED